MVVVGQNRLMSEPTRTESVAVDGGKFDLHVWIPDQGSGPGILLIQEILGVGSYIKAVAHRLARIGYVVAAPDLFWRIEPGWAAPNTDDGLGSSFQMAQKFDATTGVADCAAALAHLRSQPEVRASVGVLGFCLGGTMAHLVAAASDPDAIVSYYGSGVPAAVERFSEISCPALYHFGGADEFIPMTEVDKVVAAVATDDHDGQLRIEIQPGAGHAFDNDASDRFHNATAAAAAWAITEIFLAEHLDQT